MGHQLIAFFRGRIEAHRLVGSVRGAKGNLFVQSIYAGTTGIDEVFYPICPTRFQ